MTLYSVDWVCKDHLEETINNTAGGSFMSLVRSKRWGHVPIFLPLSKIPIALKEFQVDPWCFLLLCKASRVWVKDTATHILKTSFTPYVHTYSHLAIICSRLDTLWIWGKSFSGLTKYLEKPHRYLCDLTLKRGKKWEDLHGFAQDGRETFFQRYVVSFS